MKTKRRWFALRQDQVCDGGAWINENNHSLYTSLQAKVQRQLATLIVGKDGVC